MNEIAKTILTAKRRKFLRSHPIFVRHATVTEAELFHLATGLRFKFILSLSKWLLLAGYGDIDENLSFREKFFSVIEGGQLDGHVSFAQDFDGNRYVFNPKDGAIYFMGQSGNVIARISNDFASFMQELIRRDYQLKEWMNGLPRLN